MTMYDDENETCQSYSTWPASVLTFKGRTKSTYRKQEPGKMVMRRFLIEPTITMVFLLSEIFTLRNISETLF